MNLNPIKVIETCPLTRAYRVFRTLGLRHIVVGTVLVLLVCIALITLLIDAHNITTVDFWNVVQGVITRKDLSKLSTLHQWKKVSLSLSCSVRALGALSR
jgi:hypothetical protein